MKAEERTGTVGYMGHDPELFCDSIENNIRMGDKKDITPYLRTVCFEKEVDEMDQVLWLKNGCVQDHQHPCCDLVPQQGSYADPGCIIAADFGFHETCPEKYAGGAD